MNTEQYYVDKYGEELGKKKYKTYIAWKENEAKRRQDPEYIKRRIRSSSECRSRRKTYKNHQEIKCKGLLHRDRYKSYSKDYEHIENYELAKADNFKGWHCHHRLELHPDGSVRFTRESLIKLGLYVNRPASELIFLKKDVHNKLHGVNRWK